MKIKLGQQIIFQKDHKIQVAKGGTIIVKAGDKARVVRKVDEKTAEIVYLSGEAKGLCQNIALEVDDDLDADSIAKKILEELSKN
ncbi:MAG: hypothetical protein Q8900_07805 [Bacillota bacterium]|nr:hypothetical protein [Bacillota bacterium]